MNSRPDILSNPMTTAREQVNLPVSIALRLCLQGIRSRLGRSTITVFGIALGVAFLTSVVAGALIKQAVAEQSQLQRQVERRIVLLRGQIGRLAGKPIVIAGQGFSVVEERFVQELRRAGALVLDADAVSPETEPFVVGLGSYAAALGALDPRMVTGRSVLAFASPDGAVPTDARIELLSLELRPDELQRAEERRRTQQQRTIWLVVVSILITAIGITNAMLMSVTERVREIGTLKCLGALSSLVVRLFLIESAIVGFIGAAAGAVVGIVLACAGYGYLVGITAVLAHMDYPMLAMTAAGCIVLGVILSIIAAIYPAHVASRMIPAAALATNV